MRNSILLILALHLIFIDNVFSQQERFPYLRSVVIQSRVYNDTSKGHKFFFYSYTVINSKESIGSIQSLEIDVSMNPNSVEIDTSELKFRDALIEKFAREDFRDRAGKIIPVGFLQIPCDDGLMSYSNNLTVVFSCFEDADFISPGRTLSGYLMMSKGLPGIRPCVLSPLFDVDTLFPNPEDTLITGEFVDSLREAVKYRGWTIGPTAPPREFLPIKWYEILTDYVNRSFTLGWIKNNQTSEKYLGFFRSAKQELEQNNINKTKSILQKVLQEVDKDSTSDLTSEAYALIRYNTEYLIDQLPEQPELTAREMLDTLRARLKYCYNTNQLGDKRFYTELDDHIRDAIRKYQSQDTIGCAQEIEEFYTNLRVEYKRKPKKNDKRYVSDGAYQLLYPLARQSEARVIVLPPKMSGTIIEQIEALKSEVRVALKRGMIGGEVLARSLERMLDRAVMAFQRQDTVRARMMMEMFLETVREVYEYTRRHPKARTYVKPAGYSALYYRGRYVVETLRDESEEEEEGLTKVKEELRRSMEEEYEEMLKEIRE